MNLRIIAQGRIAEYRAKTEPPLVYRTLGDHAVLAILDAAHDLEREIRAALTVDAALTLRRQMAALRARVDQLETLALTCAVNLSERG